MNKNYFSSYAALGSGSYRDISKAPKARDLLKWCDCSTKNEKINWYLKHAPWFTKDMAEAIISYDIKDKKELLIPSKKDIENQELFHEKKSFEYFKEKEIKKI